MTVLAERLRYSPTLSWVLLNHTVHFSIHPPFYLFWYSSIPQECNVGERVWQLSTETPTWQLVPCSKKQMTCSVVFTDCILSCCHVRETGVWEHEGPNTSSSPLAVCARKRFNCHSCVKSGTTINRIALLLPFHFWRELFPPAGTGM